MKANRIMFTLTFLVLALVVAGVPETLAQDAQQQAKSAAEQAWEQMGRENYVAWHNVGWKISWENPLVTQGVTRIEVHTMDPGHPDVADFTAIGGAFLSIDGRSQPFIGSGGVFWVEVPDALLYGGQLVEVTVYDQTSQTTWSQFVG